MNSKIIEGLQILDTQYSHYAGLVEADRAQIIKERQRAYYEGARLMLDLLSGVDIIRDEQTNKHKAIRTSNGKAHFAPGLVLEFATKRDKNGNRSYLGIDLVNEDYSTERGKWYSRDDVIEISKTDRRKLIEMLQASGFDRVDAM